MQLKLRASIVLAVVIGLSIPVTVSSVASLAQREQAIKARFAADHARLVDILRFGMQEPLWNLDPDAARPLIDAVLSDGRVSALSVQENQFGRFLHEEFPERRRGRQFTLARDITHDDVVIGRVSIEMDSSQLDDLYARNRWVLLMTALAQLLLSLVLIVALLQVRLLEPLRRLIRESQRLARRQLDEPFIWPQRDELGSLGSSLESTRQALRGLFDQIEAKNSALEQDILRRQKVEEELQRHRLHLEELVQERTAELREAKERAEVASRSKSTFLANMSHELRTPLNAVLGYTQLLRRNDHLDEQQRASLETIRQSGEHLLTLIDDLLDLSRIEAGKFRLEESEVDLPAFLQVIVDIMRVRADQKGLTFTYEPAPGLPTAVILDQKRLRQILLNLLGNAIKFTDAGQVCLQVRHELEDGGRQPRVRLRFDVIDSGIGMEPEQFERIFRPFEQASDLPQGVEGSGLGLAISRQLARMMGSDIEVASEPGRGSRFSLAITALAIAVPDGAVAAGPSAADTGPAVAGGVQIVAPSPEEMRVLQDLVAEGNMRAIREFAEHLARRDDRYHPFASRLQQLARDYQVKSIAALVAQYSSS